MRLSLGLEQKLVQKQVLAPRMIQSMEILQLPVLALEERIEQEMNENPMLETREQDPDSPEEPVERENPDAPADSEKELVVDENKDNKDDFERLIEMDREFPDAFDDSPRRSANRMEEMASRKHDAMANIAARAETLQHYLEMQLGEMDLQDKLLEMAERVVTSLDTNGYLTTNLDDLLPPDADEETRLLARRALEVVQALEPKGVGARDLRECLLLQLQPRMPMYEEVKTLISGHLEDLRDNRLPAIQRKTGYSIQRIQAAWDELKKLNPKPGADFTSTIAPTVTPDVFLERQDDGTYKVYLEEGHTPSLRISNYYRQRLMNGEATPEEREFIKRKINAAQWLIESIEQRRNTLTRVSQAIVDHQTRFIEDGTDALEPLKMQQIADKVGVHVTTVSRAVDDKWIQTSRGIFPLKRFFVGGTKSDDGEDVAWDAIRIKLQEVIDQEDKTKPYSDDELVRQLKKHGLNVARRTITKYRRKMSIPSSRQRRDWTKIEDAKASSGDAIIRES
ncbi:MAG: RNA polymerase factor sigma-54 [Planctomycetaceae bacterium]|nr:RNA polymerase factor sigma-54 [Planctomycetaceae bacterium]